MLNFGCYHTKIATRIQKKSSVFFTLCHKLSKLWGFFATKKPLNFIIMSLWDWLLAAWIYEELPDDDSSDSSHNNTRDYDSSYDYDDYEEDF